MKTVLAIVLVSWIPTQPERPVMFNIWRAPRLCSQVRSPLEFVVVGSTSNTSFKDGTVKTGGAYCYAISAVSGFQESPKSATSSIHVRK